MRIFLEVVFLHKFLWYHGNMYHDIFFSIHLDVQEKYFTSMHMYLNLMYDMVLLTCSFMVVKSDVGVLTSPGLYISFPPAVSLVL